MSAKKYQKTIWLIGYSIFCLFIGGCSFSKRHPIQIYKSFGDIQCHGKQNSIEKLRTELLNAHIHLMDQGIHSDDGMMRITVCGAPTGDIGIFTIATADLNKAIQLGFSKYQK